MCSLSEHWVQPWVSRSVQGAWTCTLTQAWHRSLPKQTRDGSAPGGWVRTTDRYNNYYNSNTLLAWLATGRKWAVSGASLRPRRGDNLRYSSVVALTTSISCCGCFSQELGSDIQNLGTWNVLLYPLGLLCATAIAARTCSINQFWLIDRTCCSTNVSDMIIATPRGGPS